MTELAVLEVIGPKSPSATMRKRGWLIRGSAPLPSSTSSASWTSSAPLPSCLAWAPPPDGSSPIRCLSSMSCWSELPLYSSASNCRASRSPDELLLELGRGDRLPLGGLDLLGHPLERLEGALVRHARHRLLDPLLGLGPLGPRDQDVLLPLGLFDLVVELAERELELLGLRLVLEPGLVQLLGALEVLVVADQRLLGEVVAALLHREHRPALPVLRLLLHRLGVGLELLLVRDGGGHLLLGLGQLGLHVQDQLVQHLLRVLGPGDQVVDVRPHHRGQTIEDSHGLTFPGTGASAPRCEASASVIESKLASNSV